MRICHARAQIRPVDNFWEFRKFREDSKMTLEEAEYKDEKHRARYTDPIADPSSISHPVIF